MLYGVLVVSKKSPIKTETYSDQGLDIKVVYCQPYKKGRVIFGEERDGALQPYGKYWRLGANAATQEYQFRRQAGKCRHVSHVCRTGSIGISKFPLTVKQVFILASMSLTIQRTILKVDVPTAPAPETETIYHHLRQRFNRSKT
ncbi:MAG: DUF2911 domain-containing protein [Bacteroidota bacterium]